MIPCGEHMGGTTYCARLRPCPLHDGGVDVSEATRVLLARDVVGHLIPMLVLVRWPMAPANHLEPAAWRSGVGASIVTRDGRASSAFTIPVYDISRRHIIEQREVLTRFEADRLRLPALFINADKWDEHWIEIVDADEYFVVHADRADPCDGIMFEWGAPSKRPEHR